MSRLSDVTNAPIRNHLGYANTSPAATSATNLLIGTTTSKVKVAALSYLNNGVLKYKAATDNISIVPAAGLSYSLPFGTNPATGADYTCYFTLGIDSTGTFVVTQGSYKGQKLSLDPTLGVGVSQAGANWVGDGAIPDVGATVTPVGVIKAVNTTTGALFVPGTTALTGVTGLTISYFDVSVLPVGTL